MVSGYMVIFVFASRQIKLLLACSSSKIFEDSLRLDIFTCFKKSCESEIFLVYQRIVLLILSIPFYCLFFLVFALQHYHK